MEIRSFFPFNSCLKHKTSLLPSIHRTPPLFCQTSSQRRPRKMPGSKTNADQSKGVERNHCTGAARSNLRASLLGPNTDARAEPGLIPSSWHTGHQGATTIERLDSGPAPVPRAQARQIATSAPSASSQASAPSSVHHMAPVLFQNNKVLLWKKESPDFPQISEV